MKYLKTAVLLMLLSALDYTTVIAKGGVTPTRKTEEVSKSMVSGIKKQGRLRLSNILMTNFTLLSSFISMRRRTTKEFFNHMHLFQIKLLYKLQSMNIVVLVILRMKLYFHIILHMVPLLHGLYL